MEKLKTKDWLEKVMKFEWEGIEWDSESRVSISIFKGQRDKVVIR